jgi:hypothetical protein
MSNEAEDVSWLFDTHLKHRLTKKYQAETQSFYMDDETAPERVILFPVKEPKLTTRAMLVSLRNGKPTAVSSTTWEKYSLYVQKHGPAFGSNPPSQRGRMGKFSDTVDELLYAVDHDQEVGSVDENGWYGLVSGLTLPEARTLAKENGLDVDEFDRDAAGYDWPMNAIVTEDSQGFVEVYTFKENRDAMRSWRKIERDFG